MLALVRRGDPIAAFRESCLRGDGAWVVSAADRQGAETRNRLHSTIPADLFLPCGGRPFTINQHNWRDMLDEHGDPIIRGMVEGANIFITSDAREALEDVGVLVVKDSSANKGGVITSSYEILAGLVVSDEEFTAIKDDYVEQVVARLRQLADLEATALITAWHRRRGKSRLADLSRQFSEEIVRLSGLFEPHVALLLTDDRLNGYWRRELQRHCPQVLVDRFGKRLWQRLPQSHLVAILAKRLASRMVYHEGLTWCQNYVPDDDAEPILRAYILAGDTAAEASQTALGVVAMSMRHCVKPCASAPGANSFAVNSGR